MADPVPSPCVQVCVLDRRGEVCEGCRRTLREIADWTGYSDEQKRAVLRRIADLRTPPLQKKTRQDDS